MIHPDGQRPIVSAIEARHGSEERDQACPGEMLQSGNSFILGVGQKTAWKFM